MGEASVQQLKVINNGSGIASAVVLDIYKSLGAGYDESIFSRFDENSFTMKIGETGTPAPVTPAETFSTTGAGDYACLGASPIGRAKFNLPDINPGDTIFIEWDMYSCCILTCTDEKVKGWSADIDYSDVCDITAYSNNTNGQGTNSQNMTFFTETPTDIYDGLNEDYAFIVSSFI